MVMTKDERKEYNKKYYQNNIEKHNEKRNEYMKKYIKTPNGIKSNTKSNWKTKGLIDSNEDYYEKIYILYLNTTNCDACNYKFDKSNWKCMDHDHSTGKFRQILCHRCNVMDNWIKVNAVMIIQKYYKLKFKIYTSYHRDDRNQ